MEKQFGTVDAVNINISVPIYILPQFQRMVRSQKTGRKGAPLCQSCYVSPQGAYDIWDVASAPDGRFFWISCYDGVAPWLGSGEQT